MRFRLLRRRLTISAPSMTVRGALPWPLRWFALALMLGFSAAIGLWAFEFGKSIAGLDRDAKEELLKLRAEVMQLRQENDNNLSIVNTSGLTLVTEKAEKDKLNAQLKQLEADNRALRDDLGFFEKLTNAGNAESLAIRSLQAELIAGDQLKWAALVIQPVKNAPEFKGKLELTFSGLLNGKPWTMSLPGGAVPLQLTQYKRAEGLVDLPPQVIVKAVSAKVLDGNTSKAMLAIKL
jgi:cell division protein FtsB